MGETGKFSKRTRCKHCWMQCLKQRTDLPLQIPAPSDSPAKQEASVEMEFDKGAGTG